MAARCAPRATTLTSMPRTCASFAATKPPIAPAPKMQMRTLSPSVAQFAGAAVEQTHAAFDGRGAKSQAAAVASEDLDAHRIARQPGGDEARRHRPNAFGSSRHAALEDGPAGDAEVVQPVRDGSL